MPNIDEIRGWNGRNLIDRDGDKVGSIGDIYLDEQTGRPEWIAVNTGLFGSKVSFVPTAEARADGDDIRVPYEKSQIKDSPNAEADGHLSRRRRGACTGTTASPTPSRTPTPGCPGRARRTWAASPAPAPRSVTGAPSERTSPARRPTTR